MQMEQWENGCLTILLSDRELSGMGVRFPDMDCREPATRKILRALLENAYAQAGAPETVTEKTPFCMRMFFTL